MSTTTRHALRKTLRKAISGEEESQEPSEICGSDTVVKPQLFGHPLSGRKHTRKSSYTRSETVLDAFSDPDSELARFLLVSKKKYRNEDEEETSWLNKSMKSLKHLAATKMFDDESSMVRGMGTNLSWFYSMALEPMEMRSDRIIMIAEAYAIFGALFLSGTWVLYEWGSGYAYGSCNVDENSPACHPAVHRAFEMIMAMAIIANIFMAMFASFLWMMSIKFSGTHRNWVFGARHMLRVCHTLLCCILVLTTVGVALGIFSKMAPHWPEFSVVTAFFLIVCGTGMYETAALAAEQIPLEYYHFPTWFKLLLLPHPMLTSNGRAKVREGAFARAKELRERAYRERTILDANQEMKCSNTSVGKLLRRSANAIGRKSFDVDRFEAKLEKDWYTDAAELEDMSVDVLSRYMPRRLAEEVYRNLHNEDAMVSGKSIYKSSIPVRWSMTEESINEDETHSDE